MNLETCQTTGGTSPESNLLNPLVNRPPLEHVLVPPHGGLAKLVYYSRRYGFIHAMASYLGRFHHGFWRLLGPFFTRSYLNRWLRDVHPKVLNLGAGSVLSPRWLAADVDPRSDVFIDITRPLPIPADSVDAVYSEEVIEHVPLSLGEMMLQECHRILSPGGVLRLTTPSLDYFVKRAASGVTPPSEINDIFYLHEHKHIYSEQELRAILLRLGFTDISQSFYRDPNSKLGHLDSHPLRFPEAVAECSQYWEARKAQ